MAIVVDKGEVRRRALPLVLEPAPLPAVLPEGDPVLPVLHELPLLAAVRLEVLRVLLAEDLTKEGDPEQVAVVERDHPVAPVVEEVEDLLVPECLPEVALRVAALVGVLPVHRVGLVEVLIQQEEGTLRRDRLAGGRIVADADLVAGLDLGGLGERLPVDVNAVHSLEDFHVCPP